MLIVTTDNYCILYTDLQLEMMTEIYIWQEEFIKFLDTLPMACVVYLWSTGGQGKTYLANIRKVVDTELWLHDETGHMSKYDGLKILSEASQKLQKRIVLLSNRKPEEDDGLIKYQFGSKNAIIAYLC